MLYSEVTELEEVHKVGGHMQTYQINSHYHLWQNTLFEPELSLEDSARLILNSTIRFSLLWISQQ
jgi:hypothetical protein